MKNDVFGGSWTWGVHWNVAEMPVSLYLNNRDVTIMYCNGTHGMSEENLGEFDSVNPCIKVYSGASLQIQAGVVLHEAGHAAWFFAHSPDTQMDEEETITFMENFMVDMIVNNSHEMSLIRKALCQERA